MTHGMPSFPNKYSFYELVAYVPLLAVAFSYSWDINDQINVEHVLLILKGLEHSCVAFPDIFQWDHFMVMV